MKSLREFFSKDKKALINLSIIFITGIALLLFGGIFKPKDEANLVDQSKLGQGVQSGQSNQNALNEDWESYEDRLEKKMEALLSEVEGAGKVKVMITLTNGREIIVAKDTDVNETTTNDTESALQRSSYSKNASEKTVMTNENGVDSPIVLKEITPIVEGVIIVAQGGDNMLVKDGLTRAAQAVLGIDIHKVQVLKMKQ